MKQLKKFTTISIKNLKPEEKIVDYQEASGLILRVSPKGRKTWINYYNIVGHAPKRLMLGTYKNMSLGEARKAYTDAELLIERGTNPAGNKDIRTVKELAAEFVEYIKTERTKPEVVEQLLDRDIVPALGRVLLKDVTTVRLTAVLKKIAKRAPVSANRTLSVTKQMFGYAAQMGYMKDNPLRDTKAKVIGGAEVERDRKLSYDEIKLLWHWLNSNQHRMHFRTVAAIKILLLTGIRSGELRTAEWSEIDFGNSLWTIPKSKTKTGIVHRVHLSPLVIELLQSMKADSPLVMPSPVEGQCISDKALSRAVNRIQKRITGIDEDWTPHDLRRSFANHLDDLGVEPYVTQKCLGHAMPKIFATYSKSEYLPKRKEALEMWSSHIEALVNNDNVISLHG